MSGQPILTKEQKMQRVREAEEGARRRGWEVAGPDDPIYSEGPSIIFCAHTPKQSRQKAIVSRPEDLQSDLGYPTNNDE